jgi:VWFA-related protein
MAYHGLNRMSRFFGLAMALCAAGLAYAQEQTESKPVAETTTKEEPATFKTRVNLVLVPVVVRDKEGHAIGTLKQEDFQLFDKGKPQLITRFTVEKTSPIDKTKKPYKPSNEQEVVDVPERFVAYVFDDIHLEFGDLARVRDAAWKHISESLRATDRGAIYSTSGQTIAEFTDDKDKLHETLLRLSPRPIGGRVVNDCPQMGYYMADMIQTHNDPIALQGAIAETMACAHLDPTQANVAESMARAAASRQMAVGDHETRISLGLLRDIVRRMGSVPGQRTILLVSPGFITPQLEQEKTDVMDRAIRANVTINTLDARGLWVDTTFDASRTYASAAASRIIAQYEHDNNTANADVLAELALGTGGSFFQNNNDLAAGFRKIAEVPEYVYLLGFSPQNLKLDGSFHSLKVALRSPTGLSANARKGYYAPRHLSDPIETAKEELREAVFSREELHELPIELHTQFFKPSNDTARVTVMTHIGVKELRFRKEDGRNHNSLTIVAVVFDRNGNYVTGNQKMLEMRLKDETIEQRAKTGFTLRSSFDVKPGAYLIRLVVRDSEGQQMSAQNGAIDIP